MKFLKHSYFILLFLLIAISCMFGTVDAVKTVDINDSNYGSHFSTTGSMLSTSNIEAGDTVRLNVTGTKVFLSSRENITFTGVSPSSSVTGRFSLASGNTLSNLTITSTYSSSGQNAITVAGDNVRIINNTIHKSGANCFAIQASGRTNLSIIGNHIVRTGGSSSIVLSKCTYVDIINNTLEPSSTAQIGNLLYIYPGNSYVNIVGNNLRGTPSNICYALHIQGGNNYFNIENNTISNSHFGIDLGASNSTVTNNIIKGIDSTIYQASSQYPTGILISGNSNIVTNNTIIGVSTSACKEYRGITLSGSDNLVSENDVTMNNGKSTGIYTVNNNNIIFNNKVVANNGGKLSYGVDLSYMAYYINDITYLDYFDDNGYLIPEIVGNSTLIIQSLTNKELFIDRPLTIVGLADCEIIDTTITMESGASYSQIKGLIIDNVAKDCINLLDGASFISIVSNTLLTHDGGNGISAMMETFNINITDNTIVMDGDTSYVYGISVLPWGDSGVASNVSRGYIISRNTITGFVNGDYVNGISLSSVSDSVISNNIINLSSNGLVYGIIIDDTSKYPTPTTLDSIKNITVSNNVIYGDAPVVSLMEMNYANNVSIKTNTLYGTGTAVYGLSFLGATNININGNDINTFGDTEYDDYPSLNDDYFDNIPWGLAPLMLYADNFQDIYSDNFEIYNNIFRTNGPIAIDQQNEVTNVFYDDNIEILNIGEKISTYLLLVNDPVFYGDIATIKATLKSSNGTVLANMNLKLTINGTNYDCPTDSYGVATFSVPNLVADSHDFTILFEYDDEFAGSRISGIQVVNMLDSYLSVVNNPVSYGDDVIINITLEDSNGNALDGKVVNLTINGHEYDVITNGEGEAIFSIPSLIVGNYDFTVVFEGDENIKGSIFGGTQVVNKVGSNLTIANNPVAYGENAIIEVTLKSSNGDDLANKVVNLTINGNNYNNTTDTNGVATFNIADLCVGNHPFTVIFVGDDDLAESSFSATLVVNKIATNLTIHPLVDIGLGEEASINVTLKDNNGNGLDDKIVYLFIANKTYNSTTDVNGLATFMVYNLSAINHNFTISFGGDENLTASNNNGVQIVNKLNSTLSLVANDTVSYGENATIKVNLTSNGKPLNAKLLSLNINGFNYNASTDEYGVAIFTVSNLAAGNHNFTVVFAGDENFTNSSIAGVQILDQLSSTLSLVANDTVSYGENATIKVNLTSNGKPLNAKLLNLSINGFNYNASTDEYGVATFIVSTLGVDSYSFTVDFAGDENFTLSSISGIQEIIKSSTDLILNNTVSVSYGENATIKVSLKDKNGNGLGSKLLNLTIIGGDSYETITGADGVAIFNVPDLGVGTHNFKIEFVGDENYTSSNVNGNQSVAQTSTNLTLTNPVVINYGDDAIIEVTLKDSHGNLLDDKLLNLNINGFSKIEATINGIATFIVYGLSGLDHNFTIEFYGDENFIASSINGTQFVNKLASNLTINTNPSNYDDTVAIEVILEGANLALEGRLITLTIDGTPYTNHTLSNGQVIFYITGLDAGNHSFNVEFAGDENYTGSIASAIQDVNKLETTLTIDLPDSIEVGEKTNITATLEDSNGKPLDGVSLKLIINGVSYTTTTDSFGLAIFEVDGLVEGTYDFDMIFEGDINYMVSNGFETQIVNPLPYNSSKNDTKLSVTSVAIVNGTKAIVKVTLQNLDDELLKDQSIKFSINGQTYVLDTDENGLAIFEIDGLEVGSYGFTVIYTGDNEYNGIFATGTQVVNLPATNNGGSSSGGTSYISNTGSTNTNNIASTYSSTNYNLCNSAVSTKESPSLSSFKAQATTKTSYTDLIINKATNLSMKLLTKDGKAISGKLVKFYVNGVLVGNATTNDKGEAVLKYKFKKDGKFTVKTVFEGDSQYGAVSKVESLKVSKETLKVKSSKSLKKGVYTVKDTLSNLGYKKSKYTVYYKIPKNVKFVKPKVSSGKISYNKKTRVLTWTVSNLKDSKNATITWKLKNVKGKFNLKPVLNNKKLNVKYVK